MRIEQLHWSPGTAWHPHAPHCSTRHPTLVLTFGCRTALVGASPLQELMRAFPAALHFGCSTAGEIHGSSVRDGSLVATVIELEASTVESARVALTNPADSYLAGRSLAEAIPSQGLRHAFVLSDGLAVNGTELVRGLVDGLPAHVTVTGGLSADGADFEQTYVIWRDGAETSAAVILGFYGDRLAVGYGSLGGWDPFGPERLITRADGNVLFELDGKSALGLYRTYLGEHAAGLPASGLLFPLSLRTVDGDTGVVRTILGIDETEGSMTFAGDMPEGSYARLMKANFDRLVDGAVGAARTSRFGASEARAELAILISCVGRKLVLRQRVEEEVEGARGVLGEDVVFTGFYSYGEISPFQPGASCELHNQTMTITTLAELGRA